LSSIFICYRHEDTAGYAISLQDGLAARFGTGQIFRDMDSIEPGDDFHEIIREKIGACKVFIVLIGPSWLMCKEESGQRRLENPNDFVRLEVALALERKIRVIPVLVGGARPPREDELCPELAALCRQSAFELTDAGFRHELTRLIESIEKVIPPSGAPFQPRLGSPALASRPLLEGSWKAEIIYESQPMTFPRFLPPCTEVFTFEVDGDEVYGTASFLGVKAAVFEGRLRENRVAFITKGVASFGPQEKVVRHYRGKVLGDSIEFVVTIDGDNFSAVPIAFTAYRVGNVDKGEPG